MSKYSGTERALLAVGPAQGESMELVLKHFEGDVVCYVGQADVAR